jgi:hypothetical protein
MLVTLACNSRICSSSCSFFAPCGFLAVARAMMLSLIVAAGSSGAHASESSADFVGTRPTLRAASSRTSFSSSVALL